MVQFKPSDWPSATSGPWLRLRCEYRELYGRWNPRAWRVKGRIPEFWYYFMCWLWRRYNVIEIQTLPPTWTDRDLTLLHGMFQVLVDYVDKERAFETVLIEHPPDCKRPGWDSMHCCAECGVMESGAEFGAEVRALYHWWTNGRAQEQAEYDRALDIWHEAFESAGGMTSVATDNPRLNKLNFARSEESERLHAELQRIEERNEAKDEEMLIRLVKIRKSLWS